LADRIQRRCSGSIDAGKNFGRSKKNLIDAIQLMKKPVKTDIASLTHKKEIELKILCMKLKSFIKHPRKHDCVLDEEGANIASLLILKTEKRPPFHAIKKSTIFWQ
jgi:hypothetical protein